MLEDLTVLEVADAMTGPLCGLFLSDLGAHVIKIEPPEWKRTLEVRVARRDDPGFLSWNRGKKSVVLDLIAPRGRKIFEGLVSKSDVVLSNNPPSVVKKLGLDYETLNTINPRIICCNVSGYGLTGKNVERPAYDLAIQAVSGVMSVTGEKGSKTPVRAGIPVADGNGGILATLGILAAYISRQKEGKGQQVDISMFDCLLPYFSHSALDYYLTGTIPGPIGSYASTMKRADYRAYQTKDGHIVVASGRGEDKWQAFCKALGKAELGKDSRFDSFKKRITEKARVELEQIFESIFRTKTAEEWLKIFSNADIPNAPINTLDKVLKEAEDQGRGMVINFSLPSGQIVKGIGNPLKMGVPENVNAPPRFGEHTKEVLTKVLNYNEEAILELAKDKVIFLEGWT
jgi:CoA:oxalate CoA-transferase